MFGLDVDVASEKEEKLYMDYLFSKMEDVNFLKLFISFIFLLKKSNLTFLLWQKRVFFFFVKIKFRNMLGYSREKNNFFLKMDGMCYPKSIKKKKITLSTTSTETSM